MRKITGVLGVFCLLLFSSCATRVDRVDPGTQIDLSGYWNDTDVRIVCEALIYDFLNSPRAAGAITVMGERLPVVLVGSFRNESSEHIDTGIISSIMEVTIFNSGKMDFVAGGRVRDELRAERQDQQLHANPATVSALASETGADFLLTGTVRTIIDRERRTTVRTYFVTAEMTDIETNSRIWMAQNSDIKKVVVQRRFRP